MMALFVLLVALAGLAVLDLQQRRDIVRWSRWATELEQENDDLRARLLEHTSAETVTAYSCGSCGARIGVAAGDRDAIAAFRGDVEWHQVGLCLVEPMPARPPRRLRFVRGDQ